MSAIEIFEAALRENTPLTSINDPNALTEYLNQLNLKSDMVLDELKRVSAEKDSFKQKFQEAETRHEEVLGKIEELTAEKASAQNTEAKRDSVEGQVEPGAKPKDAPASRQTSIEVQRAVETPKSPSSSTKARTSSIGGFSLFSPKSKPADVKPVGTEPSEEQSEEFFSYDSELPRLESELSERQSQVESLQGEVKSLKGDLAVARESTQSMVQTLEDSTRDLNSLRERNERYETEMKVLKSENDSSISSLHSQLEDADRKIRDLEGKGASAGTENELAEQKELVAKANEELESLRKINERNSRVLESAKALEAQIEALEKQIGELKDGRAESSRLSEKLEASIAELRKNLGEAHAEKKQVQAALSDKSKALQELQDRFAEMKQQTGSQTAQTQAEATDATPLPTPTQAPATEGTLGKKNKKKKKKGAKAASGQEIDPTGQIDTASKAAIPDIGALQEEVRRLTTVVQEKDVAIERLSGKFKDEEGLREEIESLRDDLIDVGQDHVAAKDKIKELQAEKASLETTISKLEKELGGLRSSHAEESSGSAEAQKDLTAQFNELKIKATSLETDLAVAQQLASSRFKDLTELRTVLQKAQPELSSLRKENTELKITQTGLNKKVEELEKIEVRHNTMRLELPDLRRKVVDKDTEVRALTQRTNQAASSKEMAEEAQTRMKQEMQRLETDRKQINDTLHRTANDLSKSKEELASARAKIRDTEDALSKLQNEAEHLKEEIELKTAQYVSAESLMSSMRDQTSEMATQNKESKERSESLEEEVADAHRLLNERSREAETMRRMLAEIEGRSDSKVREMKERLDAAIEERDKAEDDASTAGRRRARDLEELRNKLRDAQRDLRRAEEEKEELEVAQRDWKKRREDLESQSETTSKEADEARKAMSALRDALDDSERQARDLEKQKAELRRTVEDTTQRLERLQKTNKVSAFATLLTSLILKRRSLQRKSSLFKQRPKAKNSNNSRSLHELQSIRLTLGQEWLHQRRGARARQQVMTERRTA